MVFLVLSWALVVEGLAAGYAVAFSALFGHRSFWSLLAVILSHSRSSSGLAVLGPTAISPLGAPLRAGPFLICFVTLVLITFKFEMFILVIFRFHIYACVGHFILKSVSWNNVI